jgi:hypothetical protein
MVAYLFFSSFFRDGCREKRGNVFIDLAIEIGDAVDQKGSPPTPDFVDKSVHNGGVTVYKVEQAVVPERRIPVLRNVETLLPFLREGVSSGINGALIAQSGKVCYNIDGFCKKPIEKGEVR